MTAVLDPISPTIFKPKMASSSSRSPDRSSVQQVAIKALQVKAVQVERLEGSVFRTFRLQPVSDYFYVLRCKPSSHVRLLRFEQDRLQTEGYVLQALRGRNDLYVPRLIQYQASTVPLGSQYLISGPFKGSILSDVEPHLSNQAYDNVQKSLGQYVRQLAAVTGPSFGAVRPPNATTGSPSWSRCFASLLESALRDGEDAALHLPYDFIRDQCRRQAKVLEQITQPRLTLLEMREDSNIVVNSEYNAVAGVLDFSTAIWADPFICDCFYMSSDSFGEGFGGLPNRNTSERIRQYLYTMYHSLLAIIRQCYRPSDDGDELAARRCLTAALTRLGQISKG